MRARSLFTATAAATLALAPMAVARAEVAKPVTSTQTIKAPDGPKVAGGGRITVDKPVVDAGDVVRGQPANAVFEIKNTGKDVLKIISAKPG